jgi:hypothetical protein
MSRFVSQQRVGGQSGQVDAKGGAIMKTAPMMLLVLPRFRWFVRGFGLCATGFGFIDGYLSPVILIFFALGAMTYAPEYVNRRLVESSKRIAEQA